MKTIIDKLHRELNKKSIDWDGVEEYVGSLGESINMYDKDGEESILSEAYMSHQKAGYVNEKLTDMFIKHGFDVSANEGKNGASCLRALCWSSYDKYILHIAEKLLELGADSTISSEEDIDDENKGVLSSIAWKFGYWNTGEYDSANMFVAYYEMVERQQGGKQYKGIRAFRDSVGEVVTKVEKLKVYNQKKEVRTSYLLYCGDKQLIVSDYVELMVNPYVKEEAIEVEDVTVEFQCLVGAKVRGLRYFNSSLAKLNFDNGKALLIGFNDSMGISESGAWFRITTSEQAKLPKVGTSLESIKLWGSISHADNSTFYSENTIVLETKERAYSLYSHSSRYGEATVRAEELDKELVFGLHRSIDVHNPVLNHVEYSGKAINWLSVKCDEGIIYIVTNHFTEVALYMSDFEVDEDEILKVGFYTKGLKKIKFVG